VGSLEVGKRGDLVILDAPSYVHLAYRPGVPLVTQTWVAGRRVYNNAEQTSPPQTTGCVV
jgi:imidazolonepropionase